MLFDWTLSFFSCFDILRYTFRLHDRSPQLYQNGNTLRLPRLLRGTGHGENTVQKANEDVLLLPALLLEHGPPDRGHGSQGLHSHHPGQAVQR